MSGLKESPKRAPSTAATLATATATLPPAQGRADPPAGVNPSPRPRGRPPGSGSSEKQKLKKRAQMLQDSNPAASAGDIDVSALDLSEQLRQYLQGPAPPMQAAQQQQPSAAANPPAAWDEAQLDLLTPKQLQDRFWTLHSELRSKYLTTVTAYHQNTEKTARTSSDPTTKVRCSGLNTAVGLSWLINLIHSTKLFSSLIMIAKQVQ